MPRGRLITQQPEHLWEIELKDDRPPTHTHKKTYERFQSSGPQRETDRGDHKLCTDANHIMNGHKNW